MSQVSRDWSYSIPAGLVYTDLPPDDERLWLASSALLTAYPHHLGTLQRQLLVRHLTGGHFAPLLPSSSSSASSGPATSAQTQLVLQQTEEAEM